MWALRHFDAKTVVMFWQMTRAYLYSSSKMRKRFKTKGAGLLHILFEKHIVCKSWNSYGSGEDYLFSAHGKKKKKLTGKLNFCSLIFKIDLDLDPNLMLLRSKHRVRVEIKVNIENSQKTTSMFYPSPTCIYVVPKNNAKKGRFFCNSQAFSHIFHL